MAKYSPRRCQEMTLMVFRKVTLTRTPSSSSRLPGRDHAAGGSFLVLLVPPVTYPQPTSISSRLVASISGLTMGGAMRKRSSPDATERIAVSLLGRQRTAFIASLFSSLTDQT